MTTTNILRVRSTEGLGFPRFLPAVSPQPALVEANGRRAKIWEISPSLHCSIIGTCLSAAELRQFLIKYGDADTRAASDHTLHKRGVLAAANSDKLGKALHKLLDARHETAVRQFAKASSTNEVRDLWMRAFEEGAIPGGYWAMITHPETNRALIEEAFGQIHMLSHMIGSSNRMDIRRLRELEKALTERDEKLARQQARLAESGIERAALMRDVERLSLDLRAIAAANDAASPGSTPHFEALTRRLETEKSRANRLSERVAELEAALAAARDEASLHETMAKRLESEIGGLERMFAPPDACTHEIAEGKSALNERTILYVGGRPGLIAQLKRLCAGNGGRLLAHDGGVEESLGNLPGLVSRADIVVFPVDCVSHSAVGLIRKACRDSAKEFLPLRTASIASFVDALAGKSVTSLHSDGCC